MYILLRLTGDMLWCLNWIYVQQLCWATVESPWSYYVCIRAEKPGWKRKSFSASQSAVSVWSAKSGNSSKETWRSRFCNHYIHALLAGAFLSGSLFQLYRFQHCCQDLQKQRSRTSLQVLTKKAETKTLAIWSWDPNEDLHETNQSATRWSSDYNTV